MEKIDAFELLGINKFHKAGYTGTRVRILNDEKIIKDYKHDYPNWDKIIVPAGYQKNSSKWHGSACQGILMDICPDAQYTSYPFGISGSAKNYKSACAEYIKENKIHLFTSSSLGGNCSAAKKQALQDCIDAGCTFFAAAGNNGLDGLLGESKCDKYFAIGAVDEDTKKKGLFKWLSYSSVGKELDYVSIAIYGIGTSYTTPTFCAMCGLVQDFFIDKTGRALVRSELEKFINDNLKDVGDLGFDIKTGHGLFILPDIDKIDIARYVPEYAPVIPEPIKPEVVPEVKDEVKVEEVKTPVQPTEPRKLICLDHGHAKTTAGKRSPDSSFLEYRFNRQVTALMKDMLSPYVDVMYSVEPELTDDLSLTKRANAANNAKADLFVSVHANAAGDGSQWYNAQGWEVYVCAKGGNAEKLAIAVNKAVLAEIPTMKDRGVKTANFTVLTKTTMPAILIESGFYDSKEEVARLKDENYVKQLAKAYVLGILNFLGIKYVEPEIPKAENDSYDGVLQIGNTTLQYKGKEYELNIAPILYHGNTMVPISFLRNLGFEIQWISETQQVLFKI